MITTSLEATSSTIDRFLLSHYHYSLGLTKEFDNTVRVYCGEKGDTEESVAYVCENQNPAHRIIFAEVTQSATKAEVLQNLANYQILLREYPFSEATKGDLTCTQRVDVPFYEEVEDGFDCKIVFKNTTSEELYSSVFFVTPKGYTKGSLMFVVANITKTTSPQEVERELLRLFKNKKSKESRFAAWFAQTPLRTKEGEGVYSVGGEQVVVTNDFLSSVNTFTSNKSNSSSVSATVCDAVDVTNCYPVYCTSPTAVWNYSLNRCIEPDITATSTVKALCQGDKPIWDGSKCRQLFGNVVLSRSCSIEGDKKSCPIHIAWSAKQSVGQVEARMPLNDMVVVLGSGQSGGLQKELRYREEPYVVELYDSTGKIAEGTFGTTCAPGVWSESLQVCVMPEVKHVHLVGEYYSTQGAMELECSGSDAYKVVNTDTGVAVATGVYKEIVRVPLSITGNYSATCLRSDRVSSPVVKYFHATNLPSPEVFLLISPRTLLPNQKTVINWSIHFPTSTCTLFASPVCSKSGCSAVQREAVNDLNAIFEEQKVDIEDGVKSRTIKESLTTLTKEHEGGDWMTSGQKTVEVGSTLDVHLSCGEKEAKKRIYVETGTSITNER